MTDQMPPGGSGEVRGPAAAGPRAPEPSAPGWQERADRLAARSLTAGDPTGWFERLYAAAAAGDIAMPWDRAAPRPSFVEWVRARRLTGSGRRAIVVGCGLGFESEYVAALGFDTVAFDVAPTAVRVARDRHPGSAVHYVTADVLDPPADWRAAFDLVVEVYTVQALPDPPRRRAIGNIARMVAPAGTLIVIAAARDERDGPAAGPPWPLTRDEIESFAATGLRVVGVETCGTQRTPRHASGVPSSPPDRTEDAVGPPRWPGRNPLNVGRR